MYVAKVGTNNINFGGVTSTFSSNIYELGNDVQRP
jgi:hypothetical protein